MKKYAGKSLIACSPGEINLNDLNFFTGQGNRDFFQLSWLAYVHDNGIGTDQYRPETSGDCQCLPDTAGVSRRLTVSAVV